MSLVTQPSGGAPARASGNLLYNVLELILDRGLVIDVFVRVSLVGIEVVTIDARVVVASVDTYLRFAEACNRLDLNAAGNPVGLPELIGEVVEETAEGKVKGVLDGVGSTIADTIEDLTGSARSSERRSS
jgi:gas vesicle structural protein